MRLLHPRTDLRLQIAAVVIVMGVLRLSGVSLTGDVGPLQFHSPFLLLVEIALWVGVAYLGHHVWVRAWDGIGFLMSPLATGAALAVAGFLGHLLASPMVRALVRDDPWTLLVLPVGVVPVVVLPTFAILATRLVLEAGVRAWGHWMRAQPA
ncbi:MAG: hypothetical protein Q4G34_10405 [Micrococcus sp.]|nr:hypothetical protein [Micrococcus sp.]